MSPEVTGSSLEDYRARGDLVQSSIKSTTTVAPEGSNTPEGPDRHPNIKLHHSENRSHPLIQFLQRVRGDGIILPHHTYTKGTAAVALRKAFYVHSFPLQENLN